MAGFFRRMIGSGPAAAEPAAFQVDPGEVVYAIGDIHGRSDLLVRLFEMIGADIEGSAGGRAPRVVFLGDYIDRGDQSRDVLEILEGIGAELGEGAVFLRGNHEAALLDFLDDPDAGADWLRWGGLQTLGSFRIKPPAGRLEPGDRARLAEEMRAALGSRLDFLRRTKLMHRSGDVVFSHSGIDPRLPLRDQTEAALLWGRSDFIETGGVGNLRVVHGHWDAAEAVVTPHRICVDTGAYYSGRLTAVRLDSETRLMVADALDPGA